MYLTNCEDRWQQQPIDLAPRASSGLDPEASAVHYARPRLLVLLLGDPPVLARISRDEKGAADENRPLAPGRGDDIVVPLSRTRLCRVRRHVPVRQQLQLLLQAFGDAAEPRATACHDDTPAKLPAYVVVALPDRAVD